MTTCVVFARAVTVCGILLMVQRDADQSLGPRDQNISNIIRKWDLSHIHRHLLNKARSRVMCMVKVSSSNHLDTPRSGKLIFGDCLDYILNSEISIANLWVFNAYDLPSIQYRKRKLVVIQSYLLPR